MTKNIWTTLWVGEVYEPEGGYLLWRSTFESTSYDKTYPLAQFWNNKMEIIYTLILFSVDVQNSLHTNPSKYKIVTLKGLGTFWGQFDLRKKSVHVFEYCLGCKIKCDCFRREAFQMYHSVLDNMIGKSLGSGNWGF